MSWLGALTLSDGWLQAMFAASVTIVLALIGWLGKNQRRSNEKLAETAESNAKVAGIVSEHSRRLERIERWQDTDRYADVIEHRRETQR